MKDKRSLRKELLDRRDAIPPEVRKIKDRLIRERFLSLDEVTGAHVFFFFASFRSEVDTFEMMRAVLSAGKKVLVPKVEKEKHSLLLYEIRDTDELAPGFIGIPEPHAAAEAPPADVSDADLVVIPGSGFDPAGDRIGYGGGYYDRLLAGLKRDIPVIAPAYEEQIVASIPAEPHDVRISVIVTDRRVIRCGGIPQ